MVHVWRDGFLRELEANSDASNREGMNKHTTQYISLLFMHYSSTCGLDAADYV